jgi:heme oxygenase
MESAQQPDGATFFSHRPFVLTMILAALREQTRPLHDRVEKRLDLLALTRSPERYRTVLQRFYGFYVPVEERLLMLLAANPVPGLDYQERYKTPKLVRDLNVLLPQLSLADLPLCPTLPSLDGSEQVVGCLYVLEGASLGAQIISRHLREAQGITPENGGAFFHAYGAETGRMWKNFGTAATEFADHSATPELIIAAACETFECLEAWACEGLPAAAPRPALSEKIPHA